MNITFPTLNPNALRNLTFAELAQNITSWILVLAGIIAVVYLIYSGILYITAGGDSEKATKGRTGVINAVIGIIIILLALAIVSWVSRILTSGTS